MKAWFEEDESSHPPNDEHEQCEPAQAQLADGSQPQLQMGPTQILPERYAQQPDSEQSVAIPGGVSWQTAKHEGCQYLGHPHMLNDQQHEEEQMLTEQPCLVETQCQQQYKEEECYMTEQQYADCQEQHCNSPACFQTQQENLAPNGQLTVSALPEQQQRGSQLAVCEDLSAAGDQYAPPGESTSPRWAHLYHASAAMPDLLMTHIH